jgi:hypothetical protein
MAKFGLFKSGAPRAVEQYEGDRMIQYVQIVNDRPGNNVEIVAAIKLSEGQRVREISTRSSRR